MLRDEEKFPFRQESRSAFFMMGSLSPLKTDLMPLKWASRKDKDLGLARSLVCIFL
jgi:hypothetical protein